MVNLIVKIGDKLYSSKVEPIMLVLSNEEKELIREMGIQRRFCSFPEGSDMNEVIKFMELSDEILELAE